MTVATPGPARVVSPARFSNGAEWHRALGDVPLERVIFNPWPGTATEADLLRLVERDKRLCELVDGTLVEKRLGYWEARIALILGAALLRYVEEHDLGIVTGADSTLRLPGVDYIRLPDVAFVATENAPSDWVAVPHLAPDLAVEIFSDGNTEAEMARKLGEYLGAGTRLVWHVDPRSRTVTVHRADGSSTALYETDALDGEQVIPGFRMNIAELFKRVPRRT